MPGLWAFVLQGLAGRMSSPPPQTSVNLSRLLHLLLPPPQPGKKCTHTPCHWQTSSKAPGALPGSGWGARLVCLPRSCWGPGTLSSCCVLTQADLSGSIYWIVPPRHHSSTWHGTTSKRGATCKGPFQQAKLAFCSAERCSLPSALPTPLHSRELGSLFLSSCSSNSMWIHFHVQTGIKENWAHPWFREIQNYHKNDNIWPCLYQLKTVYADQL